MSDTLDNTDAPARARQPRAEANGAVRRRRQSGTLNRMTQFRLQIIDPEALDHANYVYRWFNDDGTNLLRFTRYDDYDFVSGDELGAGFDHSSVVSESDARIRQLVGAKPDGSPLYAYLCKKPRAFWEADYDEDVVRPREDMMAGRVFRAEATDDGEHRPGGDDKFYATPGNQIGHAAARERRRGPVPRKL